MNDEVKKEKRTRTPSAPKPAYILYTSEVDGEGKVKLTNIKATREAGDVLDAVQNGSEYASFELK